MAELALAAGPVLAYNDTGGGGIPVLLSHGLLLERTVFTSMVARLSREHRCITWDQRGHGDTRSDGPYTLWDSADDLIELSDALWDARRSWMTLTDRLDQAACGLFAAESLEDRLAEIVPPMFSIHGLADISTPVENAKRGASETPNARGIVLLEDAPHTLILTHAETANALTAAFVAHLASVESQSAAG